MTKPHVKRSTTKVSRTINVSRTDVFQAFINPDALEAWRAPDNMKARLHNFEACEGGTYRMSLTYQDPEDGPGGKTTDDTDTYQSTFLCEDIPPGVRPEDNELGCKLSLRNLANYLAGTLT